MPNWLKFQLGYLAVIAAGLAVFLYYLQYARLIPPRGDCCGSPRLNLGEKPMKTKLILATVLSTFLLTGPSLAHEPLVCDLNSQHESCEDSNIHKPNHIIEDQQEEYTGNDFEVGTEIWVDTQNDDAGIAIGFTWWF